MIDLRLCTFNIHGFNNNKNVTMLHYLVLLLIFIIFYSGMNDVDMYSVVVNISTVTTVMNLGCSINNMALNVLFK